VAVPVVDGCGVVAPEFCCVLMMLCCARWASERICLRFLLRRYGGFQAGFLKGLWILCMSRVSRRAACVSSLEAVVMGAMVSVGAAWGLRRWSYMLLMLKYRDSIAPHLSHMRESLEHALLSVFSEVCRGVRFPQTNDERQLLLEFANGLDSIPHR